MPRGIPRSYLETDTTLASNSDLKVPSTKATRAYVVANSGPADVLVYKGATDCSGNPNYPAADAGDLYMVSVAGKIGGASGISVEIGDMFLCKTDGTLAGTQAQRGTAWNVIQSNLLGPIPVKASGAEVDIGTDDAKFVTPKAIADSSLGGGIPTFETATGDRDGVNDEFTFTAPPLLIYRNGVMERRLGTILGNVFTFNLPPDLGDDIEGLV